MQTFLTAAALLSVSACSGVTFHDGIDVPHARAATMEKHFNPELPASESFFKQHITTHQLPPSTVSRTSLEAPPAAAAVVQEESSVQQGNGILSSKPRFTDLSVQNLKTRTKFLHFGMKHPQYREAALQKYNELREKDGLEPLSYERIMRDRARRKEKFRMRKFISFTEQRKLPPSNMQDLFPKFLNMPQVAPRAHHSLRQRFAIRTRMDELNGKNRPLTEEETQELNTLSKQYSRIRELHRRGFS